MQKEAKEKIKKLIEKYEEAKTSGRLKLYSEEETKKGFIEPLFEILGWDISNKKEVSLEESISSQRVDYGFYLNDRIKFYLEAKKFSVDLYSEDCANQAVRYSFNKGAVWAVLTNFETLIIFNAQDIERKLTDKKLLTIHYNEYADKFDKLWLLSKEAFEKDSLDKYGEEVGKKIEKVPISSLLYKDLQQCREILIKDLSQWNKNISSDDLDEGVQKILDRLLFIRVAEDRGVEPATLIPMAREYYSRKDQKETLYQTMIEKFRELDAFYNSNLFSKHPFEDWEEFSGATAKVINILYGKDGYYEYDFKAMPSDVLGAVYENYLSHRLSKSKKGTTVSKDAGKRKEQGIYYTPSYIVDYIVKNALGPVLDKCRSIRDIKKIKVLDPACGSGSFLVKAVDIIADKYKGFGYKDEELLKRQIIDENIYGVDLDTQAVEITRLNLLINALSERTKFSPLKNIKNGNSLTFDWREEFSEVFKQGGFDVVIGNPPYIKEFVSKDAFDELHSNPYYQGKMDIWTMFACMSIDLLKENGLLGFIAPNNWVTNAGASIFRSKILKDGELKSFIDFVDYKVFEKAGIQTMIFVFEKKHPNKKYLVNYLKITDKNIAEDKLIADIFGKKTRINIEPEKLLGKNITFESSDVGLILDKIQARKNFELTKKEVGQGIVSAPDKYFLEDNIDEYTDKEKNYLKKYYTSSYKYHAGASNGWLFYMSANNFDPKKIDEFSNIKKHFEPFKKQLTEARVKYGTPDKPYFFLHREREERFFIKGPKIVCGVRTKYPGFFYTENEYYGSRALNFIKTDRVNLKYLTGILNSKISYFWLKNKGKQLGDLLQIDKGPLLEIPLCVRDKNQQKQIIVLVDKMLKLNKELQKVTENSEKWNSMKSEIEKTDKKIDQEVYKMYGLTEEEIKKIEK
ncbi:MAG TPA: N-6 DNA methylase [Candidatus Nanoarchaeia archaeon]|nr:N-6 DNA methylase [Candidatus Nanoarchaeia archaeon]